MPIKVECEICGAKYRVGDHRAGRRIPCKECGADMRVPGAGGRPGGSRGAIPLSRSRTRPDDGDDEYLEDAGDSNARLWMALGVGGVAAVGVIIAVIVSLSGGDDEPAGDAVAQNDETAAAQPDPFVNPTPEPPHVPPTFPTGTDGNGGAANAGAANPSPNPPAGFGANDAAQAGNARPFGGPADPAAAEPPPQGFGDGKPLAGQPFAGGALPDAPPENWNAKADPRAAPIAFDLSRKIDVNLPPGARPDDVLFPSSYAPFVAVGKFDDRQALEIWNLQDKSRMGRIAGVRLGLGKRALSNDGKYFAAAGTSTEGVLVWDVKASKGLLQFPPPAQSFYAALEFAGSSRLIAAQGGLGGDKPLYIWTIPEGTAERTLSVPDGTVAESLTASPGGRYLALFVSHFGEQYLRIYDLTTGEVAGQALPPAVEFGGPRCLGLEFSADGEELAGLFEAGRGSQIWIWNMNDGRMVDQIVFEEALSWKLSKDHGRPVQWFPSKQRLLVYGDAVVDRQAKNIIFTFPEDRSDRAPRQVLDDTRIAVVTGNQNGGTVVAFELSEDILAKAQAIVEQGGESVDAALPPLKQADLASARTVLGGGAAGWNVQPDGVEASAEILLKEPIQVGATDAKLSGFWLANPAAARAGLFYEVENQQAPAAGRRRRPAAARDKPDGPARLEALDLKTGRPGATLAVPFPCKFLSMSPTGKRAVFALAKTEDRLDVYSIDDAQHVLGFRPYQTAENDGHKKVTAAVFVDDNHLLTMNSEQRLVLWDLSSAEAIYQIEQAQVMFGSPPGLSPGNKYLVVFGDKLCHVYDALTGEARGTLTFDGQVSAAAFSPDGRRFAAITRSGNNARAYVWNVETGQAEKEFPLPNRNWMGSAMQFCGSDYLLFNGPGTEFVLIDIPHAVVAWTYRGAAWGQHHPISPDGRHWLLAPSRLGSQEIYLAALELPAAAEKSRLESAELAPKFVVQPGSQVSLSITLPRQAPGHDNFPAAVEKNLIDRFQQQGITVVQGAPTTVQVSMTEQSTGKTHKFHVFGSIGDAEVPEKVFECKVVFLHQGRPVWETVSRISNDAFHVRIAEGQSLESVLSEQQWQSATAYFIGFQPPSHVFAEGAEKGYGNSQLTPTGPQ